MPEIFLGAKTEEWVIAQPAPDETPDTEIQGPQQQKLWSKPGQHLVCPPFVGEKQVVELTI